MASRKCQECGVELPHGAHRNLRYCSECATKRRRAQQSTHRAGSSGRAASIPGELGKRIDAYMVSTDLPAGAQWSMSAVVAVALDAWLKERGF